MVKSRRSRAKVVSQKTLSNAGIMSVSLSQAGQEKARNERSAKRVAHKERKEGEAEAAKAQGNDLFRQEKYAEAALAFVKASAIAGTHAVCLSNAAAAYLKLDRYGNAALAATGALSKDPKNIKARYRRGMARKGMDLLKAAILDFENVLKLDPNCNEARAELAIVRQLWESGEGDETGFSSSEDESPRPGDAPEDDGCVSDSSDYHHEGNGIPCRFYNHGGCNKGTVCAFSHAPDGKSIRDDLGKNVCMFFLFDRCRFGEMACIYSHCKDFLPDWPFSFEDRRQLFRDAMSQSEHGGSVLPPFFNVPPKPKAWMSLLNPAPSRGPAPASARASPAPFVLLISLMEGSMFNEIHGHFLSALRFKAEFVQARTQSEALDILSHRNVAAIFVTDPAITKGKGKHSKLVAKLVEYVKAGGTIVFGGQFSNHISHGENDAFFKNVWGLEWTMGSYHRTDFTLNLSRRQRLFGGPAMPERYNVKTVHLKGVAPQDVVYGPARGSHTQSMVFAPQAVDPGEVPVVYTHVGAGYVGYNGDVNGEDESTNVILSMLGLPKQDRNADRQAGSSRPSRETKQSAAPFVLLISLMQSSMFTEIHGHFLATLRSKADFAQASTQNDALDILSHRTVTAIFVTDPAITKGKGKGKHPKLVAKLAEYVNAGGTLVFGGQFSNHISHGENDAFFQKVWGLEWTMGSYHRADFALNPHRRKRLFGGPAMPERYNVKTVHLRGVAQQDVVYGPAPGSATQSMVFAPRLVSPEEVPVAYAHVGAGHVGYNGDVNGEDESTNVILSMLGLPARDRPMANADRRAGSARQEPPKQNPRGVALSETFRGWDGDSDSDDYGSDMEERARNGGYGSEMAERMLNGGYTHDEMYERMCQGIEPWDDDW